MVRTSVTHREGCLNTLEAKDPLTSSDLLAIEGLLKNVQALDVECKEHPYAVIDLVRDDEQVLDKEQAVMDDHKDKVAEIIEGLQELRPKAKAALSVAHSTGHLHHLCTRLNNMEWNLCLVRGKMNTLIPGPDLDSCLLLQEQVSSIQLDLSDIIRDILSSEKEEEDLLQLKDSLHEVFTRLCLI